MLNALAALVFLLVGCGPINKTSDTSEDLFDNSYNFKNKDDVGLEVGSSTNDKEKDTRVHIKPKLSRDDAKEILLAASKGKGNIESIVLDTYSSKIAYHVHVMHESVPYDIFIDANNGEILNPWAGKVATMSMREDGKIVCSGWESLF